MIRRNLSHFGVTLLIAANWLSFAHAQSSTPQQDPAQSASGSTSWVFPQFHARDGEHPQRVYRGAELLCPRLAELQTQRSSSQRVSFNGKQHFWFLYRWIARSDLHHSSDHSLLKRFDPRDVGGPGIVILRPQIA